MNITPELAAKVLDADLRNIVKKVSDGGILSPSERQMLQNAAFPESQVKAKRALVLALKYSSGARLTAGELSEVREMHPDFAPEAVPVEGAAIPVASAVLHLTPEPSPAAGDTEVTGTQIAKWTAMYGAERRQIYRWIARGKERDDPCPLDEPAKMPDWIEKHLEKKRSSLIEKVAAAAAFARASEPPQIPVPEPALPDAPAPPPAAGNATPDAKGFTIKSLDLSKIGGVEGQMYESQSRFVAAIQIQLADAYTAGDDLRIGKLQARLDKAGEQLRKYEVAAEKRAIRMGEYLPKSEVFKEVMEALNTLGLMRDQRKKRVRAQLPDVDGAILTRIEAALELVGAAEEDVLRNLAKMKTPADVLLALAA